MKDFLGEAGGEIADPPPPPPTADPWPPAPPSLELLPSSAAGVAGGSALCLRGLSCLRVWREKVFSFSPFAFFSSFSAVSFCFSVSYYSIWNLKKYNTKKNKK